MIAAKEKPIRGNSDQRDGETGEDLIEDIWDNEAPAATADQRPALPEERWGNEMEESKVVVGGVKFRDARCDGRRRSAEPNGETCKVINCKRPDLATSSLQFWAQAGTVYWAGLTRPILLKYLTVFFFPPLSV